MSPLLLALAFAAPPSPEIPFVTYRLANGLQVILHRDPAVPRVAVIVAYHVGAKNERAGRTGFAHFFEHMMFRGTPHVPNYDLPLQEAGVSSNAFTTEDATVYFEAVPSNYLQRALYQEAERMAFLPQGLDQKKFDVEREVVKNERLQNYENQPYGLAEEAIVANLFPKGHPYSWSVIGSMKDLNAATLDDLRQFFAEYYHPGNAVLTLSGDFDLAEAKTTIEKYFAPLKAGPAKRAVMVPPTPPAAKKVTLKDNVKFPRLYLVWPSVGSGHPDEAALKMLEAILGSGESSRLHRRLVRESQVAMDASTDQSSSELTGQFQIVATAAPGKALADVEKEIQDELRKIQAAPPTQAELDRALVAVEKAAYAGIDSLLGRGLKLALDAAVRGDPEYYKKELARMFAVKPAEVQRVAATYLLPERLALEVVPQTDGEKQTAAFLSGPNPSTEPEPKIPDRAPAESDLWKTMPGPTANPAFAPPTPIRRTTANGIDVWMIPRRSLPIVHAQLLMSVGTADDPAGKSGLAQFTGVMLTQGTARLSSEALAEALEALGSTPAVAVGSDSTQIGFSALSRNFDAVLGLVGEMLTAPRGAADDFAREKSLHLAGLEAGPDDPKWIAGRALRGLVYGTDHPYGRPADGAKETVESFVAADVSAFHRSYYAPKFAKLVLVGDFEPDDMFARVKKALANWKGADRGPLRAQVVEKPAASEVVYLVDKPGAVQSMLRFVVPWGDRRQTDYPVATVANRVMGSDFLARLNRNLREKNGYTYGCYSTFAFKRDRGLWAVQTGVRGDATAAALGEVFEEVEGAVGKEPPSTEEVAVAKASLSRSFPENFETASKLADELSELAEYDLPGDYWKTYAQGVDAADLAGVKAALGKFADKSRRIVLVVGDRKSVEPALTKAGFKKIVVVDYEGRPKQ